jgi:GTP pyrophosphokinase
MIRFETLLEKVRGYSPEADLELLRRAYVFSALEHKGRSAIRASPISCTRSKLPTSWPT